MANIMDHKSKYLIAKWAKRIAMVEKVQKAPMTFEKRAALANALESTSQRIYAKEATNPGSIGQYKRYALDIITTTVPNLIAFDIYAVQAMDNRVGMINYLNYNYSKAKGGTPAGKTFNSSINMGKSDPNYTTDLVKDEIVAEKDATTVSATLGWYPIILSSFTIQCGDDVAAVVSTSGAVGTLGGTGVFSTSASVPFAGTITTSGTLNITKFGGASGTPAVADDVVITYRYNNEDIRSDGPVSTGFTNVPEVEIELKSEPVTASARTLRSFWAFDAQYELQKEYGQDVETLLATTVSGELAHEIDNELTLDLLDFANAGTPITWSKTQPTGVTLVDHYDSFNAKLIEGSNTIYDATRKVKANFLVCGLNVASVIEIMRGFSASGVNAVGPHFLGTLGNLRVYVNPDYPTNEFVLGYKGSTMFDAGAFYCPYMPVSSTDLIMDANFRGQRGWATLYGKKLLNSKMYIKGAITD